MKITIKKIIKCFVPYGILKLIPLLKSFFVYCNYLLHNNNKFENELSIATIIKNEAPYIKEWIEYHKIVGVEKFYIFDNESTDNLLDVIKHYIDNGEVVYKYVSNKSYGKLKPQEEVYTETIKKYRNKSRWIAFIDADEFIVPLQKEKITDVLAEISASAKNKNKFVALAVHWVLYGYSGHYKKPDGLVIENYTQSDIVNRFVKSIVNPRTVIEFDSAHTARHFWGLHGINENCEVITNPHYSENVSINDIQRIRINHYWTKSYEEYSARLEKNRYTEKIFYFMSPPPFIIKNNDDVAAWLCYPHIQRLPDKEDMVMDKYIPILKNLL